MSIAGYFSRKSSDIRMPRTDGADPDIGALYEGDVLTGKLSVDAAIALDARRAATSNLGVRGPGPRGYDPVLRHHLRIDRS